MGCPICDNKPANCDCTATEREQFDEIQELQTEIARLREERLTISTLLGKVETLEADNERLREERRAFCTVDGYPGKFEIKPLPPGPEANG